MTSFNYYDIVVIEVPNMVNPNVKKAKVHLAKLRQLVSKKKPSFSGMSEEEVIKAIRKTREEIWDKKFAARS